jgi:hypothetical protein
MAASRTVLEMCATEAGCWRDLLLETSGTQVGGCDCDAENSNMQPGNSTMQMPETDMQRENSDMQVENPDMQLKTTCMQGMGMSHAARKFLHADGKFLRAGREFLRADCKFLRGDRVTQNAKVPIATIYIVPITFRKGAQLRGLNAAPAVWQASYGAGGVAQRDTSSADARMFTVSRSQVCCGAWRTEGTGDPMLYAFAGGIRSNSDNAAATTWSML